MSATVVSHATRRFIIDLALEAYVHAYDLQVEADRVDKRGYTGFGVYAERAGHWWIKRARELRRLLEV